MKGAAGNVFLESNLVLKQIKYLKEYRIIDGLHWSPPNVEELWDISQGKLLTRKVDNHLKREKCITVSLAENIGDMDSTL